MSIKTLIIFVTVYKEESITAAARKLNLTQPAVSAAIKELESRYSVRLFERMGRGIQKTPASHHLYEFASHITSLYQEMDRDFKKQVSSSPLRIGSSIGIGSRLMPGYIKDYIGAFRVPMPYIKIDSSDIIEKMVLENTLDLALIEGCIHSDKLLAEPFIKDRLILVCSPLNPLAAKKVVTLQDLREENFLLREKNSGTRELAESTLLLHDFIINPVLESSSTTAIIHAVMAGLGISILPERMVAEYVKTGVLVPLEIRGIEFVRECHIIYHQNKYLNSDIINFMEFIKG